MISGGESAIEIGESYALKNLCKNIEINPYEFTWHDTGNLESLKSKDTFQKSNDPTF